MPIARVHSTPVYPFYRFAGRVQDVILKPPAGDFRVYVFSDSGRFYYNPSVDAPPTDRRAVETAVASLQERIADGDPADAALQSHCEAVLLALRAAYRVNPAAFSKDTIEALRELSELMHESAPNAGGTENPQ